MALSPIASGIDRAFQGLRTGDQRSIFTGALLVAYGIWRRGRLPKRKLIHREVLKPGHALVIRANTLAGRRIVIGDAFAQEIKAGKRTSRTRA